MIALPGLCLATGRYAEAADILRTFAGYVSEGMLPNRFPDSGDSAEYNTADATLWFFRATEQYLRATGDHALLTALWPTFVAIIAAHEQGTRFGIHEDPADHLLAAGEAGVQLTWMDAKVGDWVVTPRIGKPVEINGLWLHARHLMAAWAPECDADAAPYTIAATRTAASFVRRFWDAEHGYLKDVVDTPDGTDDLSLRPNQCIALALSTCPIRQRRCAPRPRRRHDAPAYAVRPAHARALPTRSYIGRYPRAAPRTRRRVSSGHRLALADWPVRRCPACGSAARSRRHALVPPARGHAADGGARLLSEVFDGDAPHKPGGCPFQAWSVAELLRLIPAWPTKRERGKDT